MAAPAPPRMDNIEIPARPAVTSEAENAQLRRKRVLLYGGIAAAALLVLVAIALLRPGSEDVASLPGDAPLIKAEERPIKVSPEAPGGLDVPNRDILVYERLQGTSAGKGPRERLLPESEEPMAPPPSPPPPAETASTPNVAQTGSFASDVPGRTALLAPPAPEPPARPSTEPNKALQPQKSAKPKDSLTPPPSASDTAAAPDKTRSQPVTPSQTKIATAPAAESPPPSSERPASGGGFQLQLLSSRSAEDAKGAWVRLRDKNPDLLGPLAPSVARVNLDNRGTFYRLRAGPIASETKARSICNSLSGRGVSCLVVRSSG
jgi:SPOR domain